MKIKQLLFVFLFLAVLCFVGCSDDSDDNVGYSVIPTTDVKLFVTIPDNIIPQDCGNIIAKIGYNCTAGSFETEDPILFNRETGILEFVAIGDNIRITSLKFYDDSSVKASAGIYAFAWWNLVAGVGNGGTIDLSTNRFAGGTGTEADPYLVANPYQLSNVRDDLGGFYRQIQDIYFEGSCGMIASLNEDKTISFIDDHTNAPFYNDGSGWTPIGTDTDSFIGYYDGGGYIIDDLFINAEDTVNIGLFAALGVAEDSSVSATVKNLTIGKNSFFNLSSGVFDTALGGIVGANYTGGTVSCCCNMGTLVASGAGEHIDAAGVVGANFTGGTVSGCCNTGIVTGISEADGEVCVGGIAGFNLAAISGCCNTGINTAIRETEGKVCAGGIVGENDHMVSGCYNTGIISGTGTGLICIGGIVGDNDSELSNCNNTGTVASVGAAGSVYAGGIAGDGTNGTITNTFYLTGTADQGIGIGGGDVVEINASQARNETDITVGDSTVILNDHLNAGAGEKLWVVNTKEDNVLGEGILKGFSVFSWQLVEN